MRMALLAALGLTAMAADVPNVKQYSELDWKVSGSLPMGLATHDYHLLYEDKVTRGVQTMVRFSKGYALPAHTHSHDETLVVLRGKLEITVGEKTQVLSPLGYAVIPAGVEHSMKTAGWSACELLVSFSGPVDFKGLSPSK